MRNIIALILILSSYSTFHIYPNCNLGITQRSGLMNQAIFMRSILDCCDADSILKWGAKPLIAQMKIDSVGHVNNIELYRGNISPFSKKQLTKKLEAYFKRNNVIFTYYVCPDPPYNYLRDGFSISEDYDKEIRKAFKGNPEHIVQVNLKVALIGYGNKEELLHEYNDDNWFKPLIRSKMFQSSDNTEFTNESLLEFSLFHILGEYELYKLMNKGDIIMSITVDAYGSPIDICIKNISDPELIQFITKNLKSFWEKNNFKFLVSNYEKDRLIIELKLGV